jgi:hypothetical protein
MQLNLVLVIVFSLMVSISVGCAPKICLVEFEEDECSLTEIDHVCDSDTECFKVARYHCKFRMLKSENCQLMMKNKRTK